MKKRFMLVGAIAMFGLGTFLVSCDKDEDGGSGECCCNGDCVSMSEIRAEGYSSCAAAKRDLCD
jgi:hypothetical protein